MTSWGGWLLPILLTMGCISHSSEGRGGVEELTAQDGDSSEREIARLIERILQWQQPASIRCGCDALPPEADDLIFIGKAGVPAIRKRLLGSRKAPQRILGLIVLNQIALRDRELDPVDVINSCKSDPDVLVRNEASFLLLQHSPRVVMEHIDVVVRAVRSGLQEVSLNHTLDAVHLASVVIRMGYEDWVVDDLARFLRRSTLGLEIALVCEVIERCKPRRVLLSAIRNKLDSAWPEIIGPLFSCAVELFSRPGTTERDYVALKQCKKNERRAMLLDYLSRRIEKIR